MVFVDHVVTSKVSVCKNLDPVLPAQPEKVEQDTPVKEENVEKGKRGRKNKE